MPSRTSHQARNKQCRHKCATGRIGMGRGSASLPVHLLSRFIWRSVVFRKSDSKELLALTSFCPSEKSQGTFRRLPKPVAEVYP